ncbi:GH1 family beta-glucosidase [Roseateles sp.]|uniref:GH1 family beta-glucosidase n=1 Tax=Roseateles sp. TaxID=1971397 RepID=UPI0025DE28D6|nr:GH1 family beta-glucosidase [Roseateles sp.]MBV8034796.1 beta-glucosidase [Roseateles sp.]
MPQAPLHCQFPPHFVWGVATSSFQIEGAAHADGKGESVWDRFCKQPGAIADASNGDIACDHYNRLEEDLDLIASLGVNCYRFSVAWPRVQPLGQGNWNPKGLDFYERLVDGLKARGIQAFATLNHWDLPQGLQERGGWNERNTVHRFVDYARHVQARLGDRLDGLTTHNEPWVVAVLGHEQGSFAPGIKSRGIAAQVSHHLLLSHGLALQALRADGARSPLGIVLNLSSCVPATAMPADIAAARMADARGRRWYADPLFKGCYPDEVLAELGADAPIVQPGDMAAIEQPMDYLGVNYYARTVVAASGADWDARQRGLPVTDMGWEIYPQGLADLLCLLHRDYPGLPPVYVTENGGAFKDQAVVNGRVQDDDRIAYLREHIAAVASALQQGVPMAGYMVWSLMDNFEWASGYQKRFGIVHVDYRTLARTPKASADWYRDFLKAWRG